MDTPLPSHVDIPPDILFQELKGEAVLLNLETERYYGLDSVGTRMWQLMATDGDVAKAFEQLSTEYDVAPEVLRHDMAELIAKLSELGLLKAG